MSSFDLGLLRDGFLGLSQFHYGRPCWGCVLMEEVVQILQQLVGSHKGRNFEFRSTTLTVLTNVMCHPASVVEGDTEDSAENVKTIFIHLRPSFNQAR